MLSWTGVRDADILGVWSPNRKNAESAAAYARSLDIGACKPYRSIADMVADKAIDAIWISGPNHARIENFEELSDTVVRGRGALRGVACEKPLARNVAEARRVVALAHEAGVMTGYLENQCFAPQVERGRELLWARGASLTGRPYLARAAEEHSGPHMPGSGGGNCRAGGCSTT
jgi:predicted dehydrogenase